MVNFRRESIEFEPFGREEEAEEAKEVSAEQKEIEEKINKEKEWAEENLSELIDIVNTRYENPESTLADSPTQLESFKKHNAEILDFCVERGTEKKLTEKEVRMLEVAAVLHDLTKGDKPPEDKADIENFVLAVHGETGAEEAKKILEKNPEIITKILGESYNKKEAEKVILTIENAIRSHMGPHPGFMTGILERVNKTLRQKGEAEIKHPYPKKGDVVAETLLAADMCSLAGRKGREKVLAIRSAVPFFKKQDKELSEEYKKYNIDLTPGQAALLSGFKSAEEARDMIKNSADKEWINKAIEDSKKETYLYGLGKELETVNYADAVEKKEKFEMAGAKGEEEINK